jgi:hypothetical protein
MISLKNGTDTLEYEITNIERFGIWLLADDKEYYIKFEDYPAFKKASIDQILNIKRISPSQFRWPDLDEDIELEALEQPEKHILRYER